MSAESTSAGTPSDPAGLHLRAGWWLVVVFVGLGILLEALHGLKIRYYLDVANETRRLLWTLAHAHGVLLGVLNLALAVCLRTFPELARQDLSLASRCLLAASLLLPAGFWLGGLVVYAGDPGLGIVLVPVGGVLLFVSVLGIARASSRASRPGS